MFQIAHLALVGGITVEECTRKIMDRLLDNNLVREHFTWAGRSDSKHAFQPLTLRSVVVGETCSFIELHNSQSHTETFSFGFNGPPHTSMYCWIFVKM